MFTRRSNFTYGKYRISNIDVAEIDNNIELTIHIQKHEQEILRMILGDCLYAELLENLELDSNGFYKIKDEADEKWEWLINGKLYDTDEVSGCGCHSASSCKKHQWSGLIRKVATVSNKDVFETLMAPYIFYNWSLNYRTLNVGVGEAKANAQNTTQESSANKRVDAWNHLVQEVSFGYPNTKVSLYQFLDEHKDEFPNASKICFNTMTYYDI
jgi:hypothetical protein